MKVFNINAELHGRMLTLEFSQTDSKIINVIVNEWGQSKNAKLKEKYEDLIMSVGNKYGGETRHETAKRYIVSAELWISEPAKQVAEGE